MNDHNYAFGVFCVWISVFIKVNTVYFIVKFSLRSVLKLCDILILDGCQSIQINDKNIDVENDVILNKQLNKYKIWCSKNDNM